MEIMAEVVSGHDDIKEIRNRETQEIRALKQTIYLNMGDAYPQPCKCTVTARIQPGQYKIRFPLRVGKFGGLEINDFEPITILKKIEEKSSHIKTA